MAKLTKKEADWVKKVQAVIDECPSQRIQAYTVGDNDIRLYDGTKDKEMQAYVDDSNGRADHCTAVNAFDADLIEIRFPFPIHSTAG